MKINQFNHPELEEGEMLLCTVCSMETYDMINYKTKRLGARTFNTDGKEITGIHPGGGPFPVIVTIEEYLEKENIIIN